jgi:predicted helicase
VNYQYDLQRNLPALPFHGDTLADFRKWADRGKRLMELHVHYEEAGEWKTTENTVVTEKKKGGQASSVSSVSSVVRPRFSKDKTCLTIGSKALSSIPPEAFTWRFANHSAIEWVVDQYGKEDDPSQYADDIAQLAGKVLTVTGETEKILTEETK